MKRRIHTVLLALWLLINVLAFLFSLIPGDAVPGAGLMSDKLLHLLSYAALGGLTYGLLSFGRFSHRRHLLLRLVLSVTYCTLLGGLIELLQPLTGRSMESLDLLSDLLGALLGALLVHLLLTLVSKIYPELL